MADIGSSPRVRGTRHDVPHAAICRRFIPARAGNASLQLPRLTLDSGSSPRVRGTHRPRRTSTGIRRFIPARAGNTLVDAMTIRRGPVHPRACGERSMRIGIDGADDRFIPARAGNTHADAADVHLRRFIPARAGNTAVLSEQPLESAGSSPRVRGTPRAASSACASDRFIPARAGNAR